MKLSVADSLGAYAPSNEEIQSVRDFLISWRDDLANRFESYDSGFFSQEDWQYDGGNGGGESRLLRNGSVFEKAAINFSRLGGKALPPAATARKPNLAGRPFSAMGVSVIAHPLNPYVPTSHANLRFICVRNEDRVIDWWFGGGFDLTPFYPFIDDTADWHRHAKEACDPFGMDLYPKFKRWADEYFYLPHRQEPRGVGGLFFDDFNSLGFELCFAFARSVGEHYLRAYSDIVTRRKDTPYGEEERNTQLIRRGRYVEFNLLYDRGTQFGLQSGGRVESILASLPPLAKW